MEEVSKMEMLACHDKKDKKRVKLKGTNFSKIQKDKIQSAKISTERHTFKM
jgi:hypothetical protein